MWSNNWSVMSAIVSTVYCSYHFTRHTCSTHSADLLEQPMANGEVHTIVQNTNLLSWSLVELHQLKPACYTGIVVQRARAQYRVAATRSYWMATMWSSPQPSQTWKGHRRFVLIGAHQYVQLIGECVRMTDHLCIQHQCKNMWFQQKQTRRLQSMDWH